MKTLALVVVDGGDDHCLDVEEHETVARLKETIREDFGYRCEATELTLFVAKHKHSGQWVTPSETRALRRGDVSVGIQAIIEDTRAVMDPRALVGDSTFGFPDGEDRDDDDTHVLVVVPDSVKKMTQLRRYDANSFWDAREQSWLDSAWSWLASSCLPSIRGITGVKDD